MMGLIRPVRLAEIIEASRTRLVLAAGDDPERKFYLPVMMSST
jgi:hypothetical protein